MILSLLRTILIGAVAVILSVIIGFIIYCSVILAVQTNDHKTQNSDAIIIFTGGKGRISAGFRLLLQNKAPKLLISGVLEDISFEDIVEAQEISPQERQDIYNHCCIDLDYIADTTATNATESAKWVKENNIETLILVTSAAHMPRAYLQLNRALPNNIHIQTYPYRRHPRFNLVITSQFWFYAAREYSKYIGSWIRLERQ